MPLVTGEIYHVFNRGIDKKPAFTNKREYRRAMRVIDFYRYASLPCKLSRYLTLPDEMKTRMLNHIRKELQTIVEIHTYCLMPNHFHFLLRQQSERGIATFISQFQNSYTRYFNTKHEREGPLFLDQFKAVRIESDEQLLHVSRYIHLNPYTSYVISHLDDLPQYPWSSFCEYLGLQNGEEICEKKLILSFFKSREVYKKFVFDQGDYQRELDKIKHLLIDDGK